MFRPFMSEVLVVVLAEEDARREGQSSFADVDGIGPACRAIGRDQPRLPRAPDRHGDGDQQSEQTAATRNRTACVEDVRRVGIEEEPPLEQRHG
jgi:hypothetical protein